MAYTLRPAAAGDIDAVFALFEQRVDWMNRQSIHQWNDTDYLNVYPKTYYQQQRELGNLYVLVDNTDGAVAGAVVLLQSDDRWLDRAGSPAYYVHNLVTDPAVRGAGRELLAQAERLAVGHGKRFMRLDCAVDNAFLNGYYESMGYLPAGTCQTRAIAGRRRFLWRETPKRPTAATPFWIRSSTAPAIGARSGIFPCRAMIWS